ncbi:MAG: class I SAM-dependent DNA methyltransferase [Microcystis viridis Mv_BB_P_19951000_S68D]|uniref:site-specific DNA-methyltransferase (adenine-specific) n=1 Tax=Microcystis viridis Mv_BB_P_19951000_S68D TaxID=2486270 RepID=A0A552IAX3_MICVR|nr:MAG: class I SAM-dependent DNA methyltransferase [Microcystis viridis Mv_BB_P_19951000_S68D]
MITYRELRDLEILVLQELNKTGQLVTDISTIIQVDVNQFAGIEYDEFAVRVAEVAMWLIDHQMNIKVSNTFGQYFVRLPLKKAAKIVNGNALRIDWEEVISKEKLNFILGNPPFVGHHYQNFDQKEDLKLVLDKIIGSGVMDYVSAWFYKSAQFIQSTKIKVGLVATNSISQGEQSSILWNVLINEFNISIHFAHRTFKWSNEAKGNAAVHCVIIGFGLEDIDNKRIFDYADIKGEPTERRVKNINPYLTEGNDLIILKKIKPICNVPEMLKGSQPTDGGNLLMTNEEKEEYLKQEPDGEKFIKPFISADEFLNNKRRWCFWLTEIQPKELKQLPLLLKRVEAVKEMRLASSKPATVKWAQFPTLFTENRQPETDYVLVPRVSSENRKYIPMGFFNKNIIVSDTCIAIPSGNIYHFGILTSEMHMTWVKYVCGRLKSDYRYSNTIVYNNYPFPENITDKQKQTVETCAQAVLDTRVKYPDSSLADLYDPLTMPPDLLKAHQKLDKAVDLCYRPQPFTSELNRIEYLFELYEKLTAPLLPTSKQKPAKRKNPQ